MRNYIFLFSLAAGSKDFDRLERDILKTFKNRNKLDQLEILKTEDENSIREISREIGERAGENLLIVCGGDGSLHESLEGVVHTPTILTAYPMGTGNDFLKNFNPVKSIDDFFDLEIQKIDTIRVNDFYALNSVSIGLDVDVVRYANFLKSKKTWLGEGSYLFSALKNIIQYQTYDLEILLEKDEEIYKDSGEFTLIALSNGQFYGGGFQNAPLANVEDGLLDVTIANKFSRKDLISLLLKYRNGKHMGEKGVFHQRFKKGTIQSLNQEELFLNADGEIYTNTEWAIEIVPKSLYWASIK